MIGKLDKLPSPPQTYFELNKAAARSEVTLSELATIVEQDPAMSVKVLQVVNSAYFSVAQNISSVQHAVSFLGVDLLKALALVVHAFGIASGTEVPGFSLEALQKHSLLTGRLAKRLVLDPKLLGEVFTASVIHDVGKIVLALGVPEHYAEVVRKVRDERRPFAGRRARAARRFTLPSRSVFARFLGLADLDRGGRCVSPRARLGE